MDRRLCAIMFTDIQTYTKLMQESEQKAIETRHRHRSVFDPLTRQYGGEIIQYYGDGTLSIFNSSVQAVECAKALQSEFLKEPTIPVRIGIHTGDIVLTEDDIIGDSVNLASRIESLGVPGSVLVSGKVADEIRSQEHLPLKKVGSFHFKNESREREVFSLDLPGFSMPDSSNIQGKLEPTEKTSLTKRFSRKHLIFFLLAIMSLSFLWNYLNGALINQPLKRLAVMPFTNRSNDPDQAHLVDGMHQEIIAELLQAGIDVEPRTTMMSYRNTDKPLEQIADELDVNGLIEGDVLIQDDRMEIKIRLVDVAKSKYLWQESYEPEIQDLFVLYRDVTKVIASNIGAHLSPETEARLREVVSVDPEAYDLYLRGRHQFNLGSSENLRQAVRYYKETMSADPDFGPVHIALIETYLLMGFGRIDPNEAQINFRLSMKKAMEHDPELKNDFQLQAMINIYSDLDWESADENLQKALDQYPNSSELWDSYCQFLWAVGRTNESVKAGEKAVQLGPEDHYATCSLTWAYFVNGQLDASKQQTKTTIDSFGADCPYHYWMQYRIILQEENWEEFPNVIRELQEHVAEKSEIYRPYGLLASFYAKMGDSVRAVAALDTLRSKEHEDYLDLGKFANVYALLGDYETAVDYLEKAYFKRDFMLFYTIKVDPVFDPLRTHPRFIRLLENLNLPPDT